MPLSHPSASDATGRHEVAETGSGPVDSCDAVVTSQGRHGLQAVADGAFTEGLSDRMSACLFDLGGVLTDTAREHLGGKPAPDMFLAAAHALVGRARRRRGVRRRPGRGRRRRAGGFGYVIGVDRVGKAEQLLAAPIRWSRTWRTR